MKKLVFVGLFAATQAHAAVVVVARPVVVAPRPVVTAPRPATAPTPPPPKASSTPPRTTTTSTQFIWPAWVPFVGSRCHDDKECKK